MNTATMSAEDWAGCPFPMFFGEDSPMPEAYYKIYHDGGHLCATLCKSQNAREPQNIDESPLADRLAGLSETQKEVTFRRVLREAKKKFNGRKFRRMAAAVDVSAGLGNSREAIDILFDSLYYNALRAGYKKAATKDYIKAGILELFSDTLDLDEWIEKKVKRKRHNAGVRMKRFRRKAYLNRWNYFVTFTYDDDKHGEEAFRRKLRKCLSNLHTRRGWRYMGVFERAPKTGRLHFHGLFYVPEGEMLGKVIEKRDYSTAQGRMQVRHENTFFESNFGRNDFEELNEMELRHGNTINYLLKYISKTGERIVYSRGIPTEICKQVKATDIISRFRDFVEKFVMFDNVVDWERDVMHYTKWKQMTMIDILCNPPQIAVA